MLNSSKLNCQTKTHKTFTTVLVIILSLALSYTTNTCFAANNPSFATIDSSIDDNNIDADIDADIVTGAGVGTIVVTAVAGIIGVLGIIANITGIFSKNYNDNPPVITNIFSKTNSLAANPILTITGSDFVAGSTTVMIGGEAASIVEESSTSLTVTIPTDLTGSEANVVVTIPSGLSASHTIYIYHVTYYGNGASGGNVPIDNNSYMDGSTTTITVPANTGNLLVSDNRVFIGWSTARDGGTIIYPGNSFTVTGNTNLYAQYSTPLVGMQIGGGTLISINQNPASGNRQLLIMANADVTFQGTSNFAWDPDGATANIIADVNNGYYCSELSARAGYCYTASSGYNDQISSGITNTRNILQAFSHYNTPYAALVASQYTDSYGLYHDWYLPSMWELNAIYTYASNKNLIATFSYYLYWSSTEDADVSKVAWSQDFGNGLQHNDGKDDTFNVRAVRTINY